MVEMEINMRTLFVIVMLFSWLGSAQAETRYIVDQAKYPMRSGQSTGHAIVRMLPSGTAVEVLGQSKIGYTHIRIRGGKEGWILSRYLMKEPAARSRLVWAERELSKLNQLKEKKKLLVQEVTGLKKDNKNLQNELARIRKAAANAIAVADENKGLKIKAEEAEQAFEALRQQTSDIRSGAQQRWFMLGGGAILLGILLGLILPRLKFRRKERWGRY
jgi:SH3 domain protein